MFRKLVKTTDVAVAEQTYPVHYYEAHTLTGTRRFSSEVILGPEDLVILDGDSVKSLELKVAYLVAASVYSRLLATKHGAADLAARGESPAMH